MEEKEYPYQKILQELDQSTGLKILPLQKIIYDYLKPHENVISRRILIHSDSWGVSFRSCSFLKGTFFFAQEGSIYTFDPKDPDCAIHKKCILQRIHPRTPTTPPNIVQPQVIGIHQNHLYIQGWNRIYDLDQNSGQLRILAGQTMDTIGTSYMDESKTSFENLISTVMNKDGTHLYTLGVKQNSGFHVSILYEINTQTGECKTFAGWGYRTNNISHMTWDLRHKNPNRLFLLLKDGHLHTFNLDLQQYVNHENSLTLENKEISTVRIPCSVMKSISGTGILILFSEQLHKLISVDPSTRECQMIMDFEIKIYRCFDFAIDESERMMYIFNDDDEDQQYFQTISLSPLLFPISSCCEQDL